jgi:hypothetical protein
MGPDLSLNPDVPLAALGRRSLGARQFGSSAVMKILALSGSLRSISINSATGHRQVRHFHCREKSQ